MLLEAGAAPDAQDFTLRSALDYTEDDVSFELVSRAMFQISARAIATLWHGWIDTLKDPLTPAERMTPLARALSWREQL